MEKRNIMENDPDNNQKKKKDNWKEKLSEEQYRVLREKGTERPFSGKYYQHKEDGVYRCAACDAPLFDSNSKFDSSCGWPSFDDVINNDRVKVEKDITFGMIRQEVCCAKCGSHLGHIFEDGPKDTTGLRYCINSVSLNFEGEK